MVEFGVDNFQSIQSIGERSKAVGSKPAFLFLGDQWEQDSNYSRIMNLLVGKLFLLLFTSLFHFF